MITSLEGLGAATCKSFGSPIKVLQKSFRMPAEVLQKSFSLKTLKLNALVQLYIHTYIHTDIWTSKYFIQSSMYFSGFIQL